MKTVYDPWDGTSSEIADTVHVEDKPEYSKLLGPDGKPLRYKKHPVGFQLTRKSDE